MSEVDEHLADLIEVTAQRMAHVENIALNHARRNAREVINKAWQQYLKIGAPYGKTQAGFMIWWLKQDPN